MVSDDSMIHRRTSTALTLCSFLTFGLGYALAAYEYTYLTFLAGLVGTVVISQVAMWYAPSPKTVAIQWGERRDGE